MKNMNVKDNIEVMLQQARKGRLGTPEQPLRNNSLHQAFWVGYFGHRSAREYRGRTTWPPYRAGQLWRKERSK